MNGGKNVSWTGLQVSQKLTTSQLNRDELKIIVYDKNKSRGDVELGQGSITVRPALSTPKTWVSLRGDLFSGKLSLGQFLIQGRYLPIENTNKLNSGDNAVPTNNNVKTNNDDENNKMKTLVDLMNAQKNLVENKMGGIENTMKKQIQDVSFN